MTEQIIDINFYIESQQFDITTKKGVYRTKLNILFDYIRENVKELAYEPCEDKLYPVKFQDISLDENVRRILDIDYNIYEKHIELTLDEIEGDHKTSLEDLLGFIEENSDRIFYDAKKQEFVLQENNEIGEL